MVKHASGAAPLAEAERRQVLSLARLEGEEGASKLLRISRQSVARAAAGLPVRLGTATLISVRLQEMAEAARRGQP